jgi:hypothetical protein
MTAPHPTPVPTVSRRLVRLLGAVLLLAAVLKVSSTFEVSAVAKTGWLTDPGVKGALISLEVALGVWFVSGIGVRAARWAALVLFLSFSAASATAALAGAPSCGCMGAALVSPWLVMTFDLAAVLLLAVLRFGGPWEPADRLAARTALGTVLVATVAVAGLTAWFGSWQTAWAAFRNRPLAIEPVAVSVGECRAGEPAEATVTVTNLTRDPIQVILVTSDCSCVTADVPAWVGPGERRPVRVTVRPPKEGGPFVRKIGWMTTAGTWGGQIDGVVVSSDP